MIPIPSTLTQEYYIQQKNKGKTDAEIADDFYVCADTLKKWKKKLGINGVRYRKRLPITAQVIKLHQNGLNIVQIAKALKVTYVTVRDHLYKYSNLEKPQKKVKITKEHIAQAAENGISERTLKYRVYNYHWSVERAVNEPIDVKKRRKGKAV